MGRSGRDVFGTRAALASACLAALLSPGQAGAVVGGAEETGALSRVAAMVLRAGGGVCTALVVAPDALLTAAHCVGGDVRAHWRDAAGAPVLVAPRAVARHPGYDAGAVAGRRRSIDLALVRLPEPLPARFEPATLRAAPAPRGAAVMLAGYGLAREGEPRSTGTFRSAGLRVVEPHGPSRVLAWLSAADGARAGACGGDSGGPIVEAGEEAVFALATWATGSGAAGCGGLSQGVLLGPQRAWIDGVLVGWGRSARWR